MLKELSWPGGNIQSIVSNLVLASYKGLVINILLQIHPKPISQERYSLTFYPRHSLQPVRWDRRDKPHWDHYVRICEIVKRKTQYTQKKGSRSTTPQIPALAHRSPCKAGRNDDKEGFFVFDEGTQWASLSLNSYLSDN